MTATNRSETFGRLLKAGIASIANCEGKTAPLVEDELGAEIGVAGKSIQRYKAGYLPPEARTVQILAQACVRRGFMNREWLQNFLHVTRYHQADRLLDQLCPLGPTRPRPPHIYENLPAPTYSQFVMREQAFAEVLDGLQQRSAAVLIVGMGGNGKTSLAREVAARCLRDDGDLLRFDAVVWVSDKDRPGTTNLSNVLDEIARTLDYPGFTQFEHDEKCREVEQLLRRQRVLLIVDNFETISDGALLSWLLRLPEPSKALITTREYRREWRSSWPVELRGMSEFEAWELISQRARVLKIDRLVGERAELEPLLAVTGGNPKALTIALGLLKYEHRPLQQVVDDLFAARGDLFDDLFTRAWALLDEAARRVLLVATFFPTSACAEALQVTADVLGFAFNRAAERLTDLALLDVQQADMLSQPRYVLHPLVRAFASAKFPEQPTFEEGARDRWVQWYLQLAQTVGYCWNDLERLDLLDPEQATIEAVVTWVNRHQNQDAALFELAQTLDYYYFVRGLWDKQREVILVSIATAQKLLNREKEIKARANLVHMLCRQGEQQEALQHLTMIPSVIQAVDLPDGISGKVIFAHILYALCFEQEWERIQQMCHVLVSNQSPSQMDYYMAGKRYLARCSFRQGHVGEALHVYTEALANAEKHNAQRAVVACHFGLAEVYMHQGDHSNAEIHASKCYSAAVRYQERRYLALIYHLFADLYTLRRDRSAARTSIAEAIDLFERMGMRRELAEARQALRELEAVAASSEDAAPVETA